ncbi:hypothetical protein HMPREF0293_0617 [Corynebacterium glucuronolyticum ATCC 51866]|uniref:Uncharacterized protein n=1 Tax=Corynebacterium glucuronolyticum ATCC 51866 TaxID=548478 RepID=A0ABP2DV13_9CORY|nr:hypothetical protein HMPREF0293_0617 [Corynebacterium glucuronolyticum ATCC 51866]
MGDCGTHAVLHAVISTVTDLLRTLPGAIPLAGPLTNAFSHAFACRRSPFRFSGTLRWASVEVAVCNVPLVGVMKAGLELSCEGAGG